MTGGRLKKGARKTAQIALPWIFMSGLASTAWAQGAVSSPYTYSGRIADASGAPKTGSIEISATFWNAETGGAQLGQPFEFASVSLSQGVFALSFSMTPSQVDAIFGDGSEPAYIQVVADGTTYPRQKFGFIPLAMRVPVDNRTLAFDATTGQLGIKSAKTAANGTVLTSDGNGGVRWATANLTGTTATNISINTGSGLTGGPITTTGTISLANTGVTAGSYTRANITVDSQGRITAAQSTGAISDNDIAAGANIAQSKIAGLTASLASREGTITAGTTGDYFRGDKTWQPLSTATVPESGTALYYSDVRVRASLSGTAPVSYSVMTGAISMAQANSSTNGYLSSADWGAFNGKQNALGYAPLNKSGDTMSGALDMGSQKILNLATPTAATDAVTKAYADGKLAGKTLDVGTPSNGQVVKWDQTNQKFYMDSDQVGVSGGGIATINNLSTASQSIATSTSGSTLGVNSSGSTHTITIPMASVSGVSSGLISNADYQSFVGKLASVTQGTGIAVASASGTATVSLTSIGTAGTYAKITTDAYGRVTAGSTLSSSDIPPLSASSILSGAIAVANGGTGATTLPANSVILGNGTNAVQTVAPGASGNVLTSTGTGWQSSALPTSVASVTGTAPISVATGATTPVISISQANATTSGYLSAADWNTFNGKQGAGNYLTNLTGDVTTSAFSSGSATATLANIVTAGTSTKVTYDAKGRVTAGTTLSASDIPPLSATTISTGALAVTNGGTGLSAAPSNGQIPIGNGTGYTLGTLTAGTGISVSNSSGAITVSATADASTKVSKSGDVMTGALTLPSNGLVAGTNQLVLAGGNVGIGTTSPANLWHLNGTSASMVGPHTYYTTSADAYPVFQQLNWSHDNISLNFDSYYDGAWRSASSGTNYQIRKYNNLLTFNYGSGVTAGSSVTLATGMVLNSSGNVGIGTSSPSSTFEVAGGAMISTAGADLFSNTLRFQKRGTTGNATAAVASGTELGYQEYYGWDGTAYGRGAWIGSKSEETFTSSGHGANLMFVTTAPGSTTNTERLRITGAGNVGIGTTNPNATIEVIGSAGTTAIASFRSNPNATGSTATTQVNLDNTYGAGNYKSQIVFNASGAQKWAVGNDYLGNGTQNFYIYDGPNNTPRFWINSAGNIGIGTTAPGAILQVNTATIGGGEFRVVASGTESAVGTYSSGGNWLAGVGSWGAAGNYTIGTTSGTSTGVKLTIKQDGNVGIGTTNPSSPLHVAGAISTGSGAIRWVTFSGTTSASSGSPLISFAHGLTAANILSAICNVFYNGDTYYQFSALTTNANTRYVLWTAANVAVYATDGDSGFWNRPYRCIIQTL